MALRRTETSSRTFTQLRMHLVMGLVKGMTELALPLPRASAWLLYISLAFEPLSEVVRQRSFAWSPG
jgi:hypothetical protein